MQDENKAEVSRRGLLRRAGTVAAGAGFATVAAAAVASPAQATDGQAILQGEVNTGGDSTTTIANNSADKAALTLTNETGAPLVLDREASPVFGTPVGSVFADEWGDLWIAGDTYLGENGVEVEPFLARHSSTFSTSVVPVKPERWLVTIPNFTMPNKEDGRAFVVPGSANYDSAGRVLPKHNDNVPDLTLDFSEWVSEYGLVAVQGTLLVMSPIGNGWISMYDRDEWPGTSSMNFQSGQNRDGFTQMGFTEDLTVHFKLSVPAIIVFDIFGFVVANGTGLFFEPDLTPSAGTRSLRPSKHRFSSNVVAPRRAK